ncbi:MAG: hypothetical protein KatS3mg087_0424 [Patescibacteria group bacterium]|nr:MAG: hypothetical protein KatS3mg087_0424 [Patescibacteria group bacterium]
MALEQAVGGGGAPADAMAGGAAPAPEQAAPMV